MTGRASLSIKSLFRVTKLKGEWLEFDKGKEIRFPNETPLFKICKYPREYFAVLMLNERFLFSGANQNATRTLYKTTNGKTPQCHRNCMFIIGPMPISHSNSPCVHYNVEVNLLCMYNTVGDGGEC